MLASVVPPLSKHNTVTVPPHFNQSPQPLAPEVNFATRSFWPGKDFTRGPLREQNGISFNPRAVLVCDCKNAIKLVEDLAFQLPLDDTNPASGSVAAARLQLGFPGVVSLQTGLSEDPAENTLRKKLREFEDAPDEFMASGGASSSSATSMVQTNRVENRGVVGVQVKVARELGSTASMLALGKQQKTADVGGSVMDVEGSSLVEDAEDGAGVLEEGGVLGDVGAGAEGRKRGSSFELGGAPPSFLELGGAPPLSRPSFLELGGAPPPPPPPPDAAPPPPPPAGDAGPPPDPEAAAKAKEQVRWIAKERVRCGRLRKPRNGYDVVGCESQGTGAMWSAANDVLPQSAVRCSCSIGVLPQSDVRCAPPVRRTMCSPSPPYDVLVP